MQPWVTDAQFATQIDKEYIFANKKNDSFLSSQNQFLIVASKGMGKTLLMRLKRNMIEKSEPSYLLIPQNETSDYVSLPASLSHDFIKSMEDSSFWEDLWKISISISALLNFPHKITQAEKTSIKNELARVNLPVQLREDLLSAFEGIFRRKRFPSGVLDILLQEGKKSLEYVRSTALQVIHDLFNSHITSGCCIFIDSFDQALNKLFPGNLVIWCAAQNGLLKAAWELSRHNRHVKVFTTIRQEAYASFDSSERSNIRGSVLLIEYTTEDLRKIFLNAIKQYESLDTIDDFVGFKKIFNGYLKTYEDIFDYICRHTISVPRWLMTIGDEISNSRRERGIIRDRQKVKKQQRIVANIVNRVSADDLAYDYLRSEMRLFFHNDDPDNFIENLISKINSSVLSLPNITRISDRFIAEHSWAGTHHPFCLLYNLGLLGYVDRNASSTDRQQIFKKPYEFDWNYENILPLNPHTYYLIHPSLHHLIQKKNYRFNFNKVGIGDGLLWGEKEEARVEREKIRIFISYSHDDADRVVKISECIEDHLNNKAIIHDIWLDIWKMKSGKWVQDQIFDGLHESDFLIFIVSQNSLGSEAVALEWKTKFSKKLKSGEDTIFPFIIDNTPFDQLPKFLEAIYCYKYDNNQEKITNLIDDILFWKAEQTAVEDRRKNPRAASPMEGQGPTSS